LIAGLDAEPLERAGRWDDDPAPPALLHHQPGKETRSGSGPRGRRGLEPGPKGDARNCCLLALFV
jgi:hypothetical protein